MPEIQTDVGSTITPNFEAMGLVVKSDNLVYGFHGRTASKAGNLAAVFSRVSNPADFYLISFKVFVPDDFDDSLLLGQLPEELLETAPVIFGRRMSTGAIAAFGHLWGKWAKEVYGQKAVVSDTTVNWFDLRSFVPAYPLAAEKMFDELPKLRCAILPMQILDKSNIPTLAWVGVIPKTKAAKWISDPEVSMRDVKVNLNFKK